MSVELCVSLSSACRPSSRLQGESWGNPKAPGVLGRRSWGLAERKGDAILSLKSRWFIPSPPARCSLAHTQTCAVIAHRHTHSPVTVRLRKTHPEPRLPCASAHSHGGLVPWECFVGSAEVLTSTHLCISLTHTLG